MATVTIVALFIAAAVLIGNIVYDKSTKAPVNWKRTGISVAVVIALVYLIEWIAETGLDIGSK